MKRVLDRDPVTGMVTYHDYDALTGQTIIGYEQDVEPILESNKAIQRAGVAKGRLNEHSRLGIKNNWWHVGSIPNAIIEKWRVEKGVNVFDRNHWPAVKRLLNDPEYSFLRTGTGKI